MKSHTMLMENEDTVAGASMDISSAKDASPTTDEGLKKIPSAPAVKTPAEKVEAPKKKTTKVVDPLAHLVPGYPKLSGRMSHYPSMFIFRRFGALNARKLLYLQSELCSLEAHLLRTEKEDNNSQEGQKRYYATNHFWLSTADAERDGDTKQRDIFEKIKETLNEYNHALIQQATILQMREPDAGDIKHLQRFLIHPQMSPHLVGKDHLTWGSIEHPEDKSDELITLKPREGVDTLSRLLGSKANWVLDKFSCILERKPDPTTGLVHVTDAKIFNFTYWVTSLIAGFVPVAAIMILSVIHNQWGRLGTIACFNVLVAVLLPILTDAKRGEVFSVTAAFAAVQVVFVGGQLDDKIATVYCKSAPTGQ